MKAPRQSGGTDRSGVGECNAFDKDINDLNMLRNARRSVQAGSPPGLNRIAHDTVGPRPGRCRR